jgi:pullulanase
VRDDLTLYGEPWTGGGPIHFGKGDQKNTCFGLFNDNLRNAVRGDLDGPGPGFATGPGGDISGVRRGIMGAITDFTAEPDEAINYVSAHDNMTLWDKITLANPSASDAEKRSMQKLALGVVLTSQGVPFLHCGVDFCRTKGGNHNSYNAGDAVNAIDWARKAEYIDVFEYVRGLAAIRAAHPAFRMSEAAQIRERLDFLSTGASLAFTLDGAGVGDSWGTILVVYNAEPREQTARLPGGAWSLVANHEAAGTRTLATLRGSCTLPAYSLVILHK